MDGLYSLVSSLSSLLPERANMFVIMMAVFGTTVAATALVFLGYFLIRRLSWEKGMKNMAGKVVLVTGADTGFGHDLTIRLLEKGVHVIAGCFLPRSLTSLKDEAGPDAHLLTTFPLDISDDDSVKKFVKDVKRHCKERGTGLHGFANNAGLFSAGPAELLNVQEMERIFTVNTVGCMNLSLQFLPLLDLEKGRLVVTSSVSAVLQTSFVSLYGASKAAVDSFHSTLRIETDRDVTIHLVMPGGFLTPLLNPANLRRGIDRLWSLAKPSVQHALGTDYYNTVVKNWTEGVMEHADPNTKWVVDNMEHALFALYPRDRYYTGKDAIVLFSTFSFMPTWAQDYVMRAARRRFQRDNGVMKRPEHTKPGFVPVEDA